MISTYNLQPYYINLYKQLRKHVWPFDIIKQIADIEVCTYTAFSDLINLKNNLQRLKSNVSYYVKDEELQKQFDLFIDEIGTDTQRYLKLIKV